MGISWNTICISADKHHIMVLLFFINIPTADPFLHQIFFNPSVFCQISDDSIIIFLFLWQPEVRGRGGAGTVPAFAFLPGQHLDSFRKRSIVKFHHKIHRIATSPLTVPVPPISRHCYTVMLFPTVFLSTLHQLFSLCVQKRYKICLVCSYNLFFRILHFPHPFLSVLLTDCYKLIS